MIWKAAAYIVGAACVINGVIILVTQERHFNTALIRDKRVLITGGSSGIGEQLAYHYARFGAHVVITARREEQLKRVISKCKELGSSYGSVFDYIVADMNNTDSSTVIIKQTLAKLGRLDHLVLNHAYMPTAMAWQANEDSIRNLHGTLDINVKSTAFTLAHAIPHLEKTHGSVAIVNSMMGKICRPYFTPYCASKFALDGFIQGVRLELAEKSISVTNCILGLIGTEAAKDIVLEMTSSFHVNKERLKEKNAFADPSETAYEVLKATALREREMAYPPEQWLRLKILFRDFIVWLDHNQGPKLKQKHEL